jgi:hypothetical protein
MHKQMNLLDKHNLLPPEEPEPLTGSDLEQTLGDRCDIHGLGTFPLQTE